jgi:hypothetical protein
MERYGKIYKNEGKLNSKTGIGRRHEKVIWMELREREDM